MTSQVNNNLTFLLCIIFLQSHIFSWAQEKQQDIAGYTLDMTDWIEAISPYELVEEGSILDVSHLLEKPAGKRGFVMTKGDKFYFEDGTEARFWGGNMTGGACFPEKDQAKHLAKKLAQLGINLVRLHHIDVLKKWGYKDKQYSVFGGRWPETTRRLHAENMDKLDYLIYCLKRQGIYIFLSHQSNRLLAPKDGFPGDADAYKDVTVGFKGEGYYDPFLIELHKELTKNLLEHVNPYTGLALKDDPVLAMMEITNENYLYPFHPHGKWFGINSDYYQEMLSGRFTQWLIEKYGSQKRLASVWTEDDLAPEDDLDDSSIVFPVYDNMEAYDAFSPAKRDDIFMFLTDVQKTYNEDMYAFIRALGVRIPVTPTAQFKGLPAVSYLNAPYDFSDVHGYWKHPKNQYKYIKGQEFIAVSMLKDSRAGIIGKFNKFRVYNRPYTISEWNECLPNPYRSEGLGLLAAYSNLNNWHPIHFNLYGQRMENLDTINAFEALVDPAFISVYPATSTLYHQRHVAEANQWYIQKLNTGDILRLDEKVAINGHYGLVGKTGITFSNQPKPEINWIDSISPPKGPVYTTNNGQLSWDTRAGIFRINTPSTQAAIGFIGVQKIDLQDVVIESTEDFANVYVTAMDNRSINRSKRLLITASADAQKEGVSLTEDGNFIAQTGKFPFRIQPVRAKITFKFDSNLAVYSIDQFGKRTEALLVENDADGYRSIDISDKYGVVHYEVTRN